ncbi:HNH endonuclease [Flavobacterium urocaniciphilum]|uniref:HNH endonuclease n=1 Tax=Flavobacterium urocaniciphilum TaxID=1299341 RepID=A0A1H9D6E2_9FLAO|nr:HNH endonuclease [Flavobacterium urocaniciphilum]SEQ08941.1 hypothetical protein SAMN05444005_10655 [Flavobacterium urocaniciphilum]
MNVNNHCPKCTSELVIEKGKFNVYAFCPNCFEQQSIPKDNQNCCYSPEILPVRINMRGGGFQIRQQCNNCGHSFGLALKKSDFDLNKIKLRDEHKAEQFHKMAAIEYAEFKVKFDTFKNENYTFENQFPGYNEYLKSETWQFKRKSVLKRDNFICQSCLANKATQIHHLTYKHVFNEPLFDLISVCFRCHEIITKMDRKIESDKII